MHNSFHVIAPLGVGPARRYRRLICFYSLLNPARTLNTGPCHCCTTLRRVPTFK